MAKDAVETAETKIKKLKNKSRKTVSTNISNAKSSLAKQPSGKTSKQQKSEPQTMKELLEQEGIELRGLHRGDVIEGVITDISSKNVYIDIGAKTEGIVMDREFNTAESYIKTLQIGAKVEPYVVTPENESGQIILSLRQAASEYIWTLLQEWLSTEEILIVRIKDVNRGGAIVTVIDEIDGFIPTSQFTHELGIKLGELKNKEIEVKIIDIDRQESKVILSEKAVSEAEELAKKRDSLKLLKPGQTYQGIISRVVVFGIFVRLQVESDKDKKIDSNHAPEGLVHISELSWEKVGKTTDIFKVNDKQEVKVLEVDPKTGKLALSIKRLNDDPWDKIEEKYPVDKHVKGEVTETLPFGIFVRLEPGISGLIHVSKLLGKSYQSGDKVNCYVESVDQKTRRLSLGLILTAKPIGYK